MVFVFQFHPHHLFQNPTRIRATPMRIAKNEVTLNSVLELLNGVFAPMIGVKIGCHFNNSMFFIKKYK